MKYTIFGYLQSEMIKYNLDYQDIVILDYIEYLVSSDDTEKIFDDESNKCYASLKIEKIVLDLPTLYIKGRGLYNRISNLCEKNFIEKKTLWDKENKIKKVYVKITSKASSLKYKIDNLPEEKHEIKCEEQKIPYKEIIDYLNKKTNSKFRNTIKCNLFIKARFDEHFKYEDFIKVIDNKYDEWNKTDMEKYLRPETLFGNKFDGYLNQKKTYHKNENSAYNSKNNYEECDF